MMFRHKAFAFLILALFVAPLFSFAQTTDLQALVAQLQKQIDALQAQIQELKAELGQQSTLTPVLPTTKPSFDEEKLGFEETEEIPTFTRTLFRGSSGEEVRKLQEFLKKDKEIYPDGLVTGFFGPLTEIALKKWQQKHNIEAIG
ncbi:MAG: peptidoglycan-binding protein, partial [Patescibacteria group bacterium]